MEYFREDMTSSEARKLFFELADKVKADEISMEEFGKIITEYKDVSAKIFIKEMEWYNAEMESGRYWLTEETF